MSIQIYACLCSGSSSLLISFTTFAILIWTASNNPAAIIACLLPFAPACAKPLNAPSTTILSDATTSAPEFTSPIITKLPSASIFCPERSEPL